MSVSTRHLRPPTLPITPWPPLSRSSSVRCPTWKSIDRAPPVDEAPQSCPQRLPWAIASAISVTRRKLQTPGNAEEHKRQETVPLVSALTMHGVRMPSSALKYIRNELGFAFAGDAGTCAFSSANCQELCVQMCLPCRRFLYVLRPVAQVHTVGAPLHLPLAPSTRVRTDVTLTTRRRLLSGAHANHFDLTRASDIQFLVECS